MFLRYHVKYFLCVKLKILIKFKKCQINNTIVVRKKKLILHKSINAY